MSDETRIHDHDGCSGDAAAYALGALEPLEAEEFRRHLETCMVCRDELAAFQQVADALPMAAPQHPVPPALRRRVLDQVRSEASATPTRSTDRSRWWSSRPAFAGGLVAAAVAVVAVVLVLGSTGSNRTRVYEATVGHAKLVISGGHAELVVQKLPVPKDGHIYEVWLLRPHHAPAPTSALFSVTSSGQGDVDVPGDIHGVSAVLVTQEPAGGTKHPTTAPVIVTPIS
jgi:anti-sigma-K factor RskA